MRFNLAERFRTPVTILTDQVISDMWEDLVHPEDYVANFVCRGRTT